MTVKELKQLAKDSGLKGYSRLNKEELIEFLILADVLKVDDQTGEVFDAVVEGYFTDEFHIFETLENMAAFYGTTEEEMKKEMERQFEEEEDVEFYWTESVPCQPPLETYKKVSSSKRKKREQENKLKEMINSYYLLEQKRHDNNFFYQREEIEQEQKELYERIKAKGTEMFPDIAEMVEKYVHNYKQDFYLFTVEEMLTKNKNGILQLRNHGVDYCYFDKEESHYRNGFTLSYYLKPFIRAYTGENKDYDKIHSDDSLVYLKIKGGKVERRLTPKKVLQNLEYYKEANIKKDAQNKSA